ncbi:MAG: DUF3800 domain-containing protein [Armatimonadota bacterium]
MYLAYFDESGDSGLTNSPTNWFVLACVLVRDDDWETTIDRLVALRRRLRDNYRFPVRPEIKAQHVRRGTGVFRGLGMLREERWRVFREEMLRGEVLLQTVRAFGVAIGKGWAQSAMRDPREAAWVFGLTRLHRYCQALGERAIVFQDEGHLHLVRRLVRRMRRHQSVPSYLGGPARSFPTNRLVEDPNERDSRQSYLIQLADWNAYAAHRYREVAPLPQIPDCLWDELDDILVEEVSGLAGGPKGIVKYPK